MKKSTIVKQGSWMLGLLLMLAVSVAAHGYSRSGERADCPGKVICPQTGDEICKDQCPLIDAERADCPGKIECSLTGEPVCRDKCPSLAAGEDIQAAVESPSCCEK